MLIVSYPPQAGAHDLAALARQVSSKLSKCLRTTISRLGSCVRWLLLDGHFKELAMRSITAKYACIDALEHTLITDLVDMVPP